MAIALVLTVDALALGPKGPWREIAERVGSQSWLFRGVADDRVALQRMRRTPPKRPRVVVLGTSRAVYGVKPAIEHGVFPDIRFAHLTHPRMDVFVIRSLVDELIDVNADAVVMLLSEFDTHSPLRLGPVPGNSAASISSVADLIVATGPAFAFENRLTLYRVAVSSALTSYRYRRTLDLAFAAPYRIFRSAPRLGARMDFEDFGAAAIETGERPDIDEQQLEGIAEGFPLSMQGTVKRQALALSAMDSGRHATVAMALLRRAVERLRRADVEVVLVETPLHPRAASLYPEALRGEFFAFANQLRSDLGIRFVQAETLASFSEKDFGDLVHLDSSGADKLTVGVVRGLQQELERRRRLGAHRR